MRCWQLEAKHNSWDASAITNSAGTGLYNLALEFALTQCVTEHTRFSADGRHRNILDLLLTNRPDLILENSVTAPISDHCCVTSKFRTLQLESKTKTTTIILPDYKRADWDGLRTALYRTPLLEAIQGTENMNIAWEVWQQLFSTAVHRYIPTRHIRIRNRNKVWMTATLHHLSRQKHRLFRAAKRSGSLADWTKFKQKRNECNAAFQKAKINYKNQLSAQLDQEPLGSHQWWTKAKKISNISSPKTSIPDLEEGSTLATTDDDKAEVLANFFAAQCSAQTSSSEQSPGAPYPLPENHPEFAFPSICEQEVLRHLQHLPRFKSSKDACISNRVLRETAYLTTPSLTYLFNLSLKTCTFPDEWKSAVVCPIFKSRGSRNNPSTDQCHYSQLLGKPWMPSRAAALLAT